MSDVDPCNHPTEEFMATPTTAQPARTRPVHDVRLGSIRASIWANDTESGTRYNVTFDRSYRDGEVWKSTNSYGRDDLLVLAKAADLAHTWIVSQPKEQPAVSLDQATLPSER